MRLPRMILAFSLLAAVAAAEQAPHRAGRP
jgi:hypothetical protein